MNWKLYNRKILLVIRFISSKNKDGGIKTEEKLALSGAIVFLVAVAYFSSTPLSYFISSASSTGEFRAASSLEISLYVPTFETENTWFEAYADITAGLFPITDVEWYQDDVLKHSDYNINVWRYQEIRDFKAPDCAWWQLWTYTVITVDAWDSGGGYKEASRVVIVFNWGDGSKTTSGKGGHASN